MKPLLGNERWAAFVAYAKAHYRDAFVDSFLPASGILKCEGPVGGTPCPHSYEVDLRATNAGARLARLELDHEHAVRETCHAWRRSLPACPSSWHDGVDADALCRSFFHVRHGSNRAGCVAFRCGPQRDESGKRMSFTQHPYCHTS